MTSGYGSISVRTIEGVIASYFALVGALFLVDGQSLIAPVYLQWQALGNIFWGASLVGVSALHFSALWLNGRAAWLSKPIRLFACLLHLLISLIFARMFIEGGAVWGAITYMALVAPLAILVCVPMARRWAGEDHAEY